MPIGSLEGLASLSYQKKFVDTLSFTNNNLSSIPAHAFKGYTKLENLTISYNPLTSIDPEAFAGLPDLQNLILWGNNLTWIDPQAIQKIPSSLKLLDVRGNQLAKNNIEAIQKILPPHVKFLFDEPKAELAPLAPSTAANNPALQLEAAKRSPVTLAPLAKPAPAKAQAALLEEPSLAQKIAAGYSIKEMINNKTIDPQPIETYLSNRLKPASTKINSLDGLQLFKNKAHYTDISFNDNSISTLSRKDFVGFNEITHLDLSNNQISTVEPGTFQSMPHLEEIQFKNNKLTNFDPQLIEGLPQLKNLDLSGNKLSPENINAIQSKLPEGAQLVN